MIYKIGDTLVNTDMIVKIKKVGSEIYGQVFENSTANGFMTFAYDGGDVIIITYPGERVTYNNQNCGYDDAMKLYDWFMSKANNETVNAS